MGRSSVQSNYQVTSFCTWVLVPLPSPRTWATCKLHVLLVSTPTNAETETLSIEECLEADQVRDSRKGPCYPDYPSVPVEKRKGKLDFSAAGRKKRLIQLKWFRSLLQCRKVTHIKCSYHYVISSFVLNVDCREMSKKINITIMYYRIDRRWTVQGDFPDVSVKVQGKFWDV